MTILILVILVIFENLVFWKIKVHMSAPKDPLNLVHTDEEIVLGP